MPSPEDLTQDKDPRTLLVENLLRRGLDNPESRQSNDDSVIDVPVESQRELVMLFGLEGLDTDINGQTYRLVNVTHPQTSERYLFPINLDQANAAQKRGEVVTGRLFARFLWIDNPIVQRTTTRVQESIDTMSDEEGHAQEYWSSFALSPERQEYVYEIPKNILEKMPNLLHIQISYAAICSFPAGFFSKLTRLQTLRAQGSPMVRLPEEIGNATELQTLDFDLSAISELPHSIGKLSKLQTLNINNHCLTHLPPEFEELTKLRVLHINMEKLDQPSREMIERMQEKNQELFVHY